MASLRRYQRLTFDQWLRLMIEGACVPSITEAGKAVYV